MKFWKSILASTLTLSICSIVEVSASRIVGGETAALGDYPYFVYSDQFGCGGALIGPDIVLWAAHCPDKTNLQVAIGAYQPSILSVGTESRWCDVWIEDPLYQSITTPNGISGDNYDFALCKLNKPVTMDTTKVLALELNDDSSVPIVGEELQVMGLGRLAENSVLANTLQVVTVDYIATSVCNATDSYDGGITDAMLCAGFMEGGKDSCQGDSGSPLVKRVTQPDGKFIDYHVGLVSWGNGCAREDFPGVYARTSFRYDWITTTACQTLNSVASWCEPINSGQPTAAPTTSGCDAGEMELTITFTSPSNVVARDTSWTLTADATGLDVLTREYTIDESTDEFVVCLETDACYTWEATGLGDGTYKFDLEGTTIRESDGVTNVEQFCATETQPPTVAPTDECSNPNSQFKIQLETGDWGRTTSISFNLLEDRNIDEVILSEAGFSSFTSYEYPRDSDGREFFCLVEGQCYSFIIVDQISGGGPGGSYSGTLNGEVVFSGDGAIGVRGGQEYNFCVDISPSSSPTASSSPSTPPTFSSEIPSASPSEIPSASPTSARGRCEDSTEPQGYIGETQEKDCSWVGDDPSDRCQLISKDDPTKIAAYFCPAECSPYCIFCEGADERAFWVTTTKRRNCEWVGKSPSTRCKRRDAKRKKRRGSDLCPSACDRRCTCEDKTDSFRFKEKQTETCASIEKRKCSKNAGRKYRKGQERKKVADLCPNKCEVCYT